MWGYDSGGLLGCVCLSVCLSVLGVSIGLASLAEAPFVKVEATRYTEVREDKTLNVDIDYLAAHAGDIEVSKDDLVCVYSVLSLCCVLW